MGYDIGFDRKVSFSQPSGNFNNNVIIFVLDMSSSVHVDNEKEDFINIGESPTGLDGTTFTAGKMYSINFTETRRKFCLRLHYHGINSYSFVNVTEIIEFKANDCEISATPLC